MTTTTSNRTPHGSAAGGDRQRPAHTRAATSPVAPETPTDPAADSSRAEDSSGSIPVWTVVLFVVGCVLLVIAAWVLPELGRWADEHGQVPVFLVFFLLMSIAGRWFWAGIDAIIAAVRRPKEN